MRFKLLARLHWLAAVSCCYVTLCAAQWGMTERTRGESPFARETLHAPAPDAAPATPLQADAAAVTRELAPGRAAEYVFDVRANQRAFRVAVSPCLSASNLEWEVWSNQKVLFQHVPERGLGRNKPSNISTGTATINYGGYGARSRGKRQIPLPKNFAHPAERGKNLAFSSGPGYSLPVSARVFAARDVTPGEHRVSVRNTGQSLAQFSVELSVGLPGDAPILPQEQGLVVKSLRRNQVTMEWQPTLASNQIEYCLEYVIASQIDPNAVMNTVCGIDRQAKKQANPAFASGGQRPRRQCTRNTQITVNSLFPDTAYVLNIIARDVRNGKHVVYQGVWLQTLPTGVALRDGQPVSNYTLYPRSKQIFSFDLIGQVSQDQLMALKVGRRPLRVSVVPCRGHVTWDVSRDGIPSQYFAPHYVDLDSFTLSDDDSDEDSQQQSEYDLQPGMLGGRMPRTKRDGAQVYQPDRPHQFEEDTDFYQQGFSGPRRNVVRPPPPSHAGLGVSTGRTSYTFRDSPDRSDSGYQITVYNLHRRAEASFNVRVELLADSHRPKLPVDPQIRVSSLGSRRVALDFLRSEPARGGKRLKYCAVATPKSQLKPLTVMSSECNIQSKIPAEVLDSIKSGRPILQFPGAPAPQPAGGRGADGFAVAPQPAGGRGADGFAVQPQPAGGRGADGFAVARGNVHLSPFPGFQQPVGSGAPARASAPQVPGPNAPRPNAPRPNAPRPNAPRPNAPGPNAPGPNGPGPNAPRPNGPGRNVPGAASNPFVSRRPEGGNPFGGQPVPNRDFFTPNEVLARPAPDPFDTARVTAPRSPFDHPSDPRPTITTRRPTLQNTLSVQGLRMTCSESTRPALANLSPGTEYAVEVVAFDPETLQATAYTSALFRTDELTASSAASTSRILHTSPILLLNVPITLFSVYIAIGSSY